MLATGGTDQEFTDKAIFGEVSWSLTDQWQITLGARFFSQELKGTSGIPLPFASRTIEWYYYGTASNDFLLGGINPTTNDDDDSVFKFNTSYQVNDETLAFFTFAQGFRAGGANQLPEIDPFGNNNSDILRFDSDTADNYEIGLKGSWNNRFTYTATLYYVEWEDFQTTLSSLFGIAYVDNIKGAESKGLEFELQGSLTENLYGGLSYSYIDAETSDPFEQVAGDPSTIVPAGTSLPGAADHNLFANLEYRQPLANGSSLIYYTDFAYRSDTTSAYRDQPAMASENFAKIDSFTIWNASLSWVKEKYTITVFGENLTNDRATSIVSTADFFGAQDAGFGVIKPRTFGLRFKWSH